MKLSIFLLPLLIWVARVVAPDSSVVDSTHTHLEALAAPGDTVTLPILVGYGSDGGIDSSSVEVVMLAGASGADSLFIHAMNASYESNDFSDDKRTWVAADHFSTANHNRRDDAACVRFKVNAGSYGDWICDWNDNASVRIRWRERTTTGAYGFGGAYSNVRAAIDIPTLGAGDVLTAEFSWNGTEGVRSGYRVFDVDLIDNVAGAGQLASVVIYRDPEDYEGYSTDADSIQAGHDAWMTRNTLSDFKVGGAFGAIVSACNDCHQNEGRDLRMFGYEPEVITSRGKFHALSAEDARNITSYIMSLDVNPNDNGYDYDGDNVIEANEEDRETYFNGRPWNPPFQPGPGLDRLPVGEWIAGAGAEAVLEADYLMAEELFPTGFHPDSIAALYGRPDGEDWEFAINRREMRIPQQLRVWNGWLPRVGAPDIFGNWDTNCASEFGVCNYLNDLGQEPWTETPTTSANRIANHRNWFRGTSGGITHEWWVKINGVTLPTMQAPFNTIGFWQTVAQQSWAQAVGIRQFDVFTNLVKYPWNNEYGVPETAWEVNNDQHCSISNAEKNFPFEWPNGTMLLGPTAPGTAAGRYATTELSSSLNTGFANRVSCAEFRGMSAAQGDWTFFAMSTHIAARNGTGAAWDYSNENGPYVSEFTNGYNGAIWYELSSLLETGNRWTNPGSPNDFNYIPPHTAGAARGGRSASVLLMANGIQMFQTMQGPTGFPDIQGNWKDWYPHHSTQMATMYRSPSQWAVFEGKIGEENARNIMVGFTQAWLDWAERFPKSSYDAAGRSASYGDMDPASTVFDSDDALNQIGDWLTPGQFMLSWARVLQEHDAPDYVVDRMARYGASLFDTPSQYATYFCDPESGIAGEGCLDSPPDGEPPANQSPSSSIESPRNDANVEDTFTLVGSYGDSDGTVVGVEWQAFGPSDSDWVSVCASATPESPNCAQTNIEGGNWFFRFRSEDDDGAFSTWAVVLLHVEEDFIDVTPPTPPSNFHAISRTATTLEMLWTPSDDGGCSQFICHPDEYEMQISPADTDTWSSVSDSINGSNISHNVTGLTPYRGYDIRIRALDSLDNATAWVEVYEKTFMSLSTWSGSGDISELGTSLTLTSLSGGRMWGRNPGGAGACTPVSGDFQVSTTINDFEGAGNDTASLFATNDDVDATAARQGLALRFEGTLITAFNKPDGGQHTDVDRERVTLPLTMRLTRTTNTLSYEVKLGSGSFTEIYSTAVLENMTNVCLAYTDLQGLSDITFEEISITP